VWNFCAETSLKILRREQRCCSNADLDRLTASATKAGLSLHSQTVQAISAEDVTKRRQCGKARLALRVSDRKSARYSLGWIPFKASAVRYKGGQLWYGGRAYHCGTPGAWRTTGWVRAASALAFQRDGRGGGSAEGARAAGLGGAGYRPGPEVADVRLQRRRGGCSALLP
jgi:hypothetical protein